MLPGLEADRARVADLDAQISDLERSLSALREEKMLVQERLDSYKYPVLEIPNEIVSDVFLHFLPSYPSFPPLTGLLSPTLLTHICRRWREIALSTPALWTALNGTNVAAILAAAIPHRARWEHLELNNLSPSHLPILECSMPLLRHLDLSLSDSSAVATEVFAPLLRTVVLSDVAASSVILPWARLTSLTLLNVYPRQCVPILQKTSNLVRCELEVWFDSDNHEHGPDITLRCLESLTLVDPGINGPVIGFLETFIVPALRRLKIPEEFLGPSPIDSLTGFISKSDCKLAEVHIGSDPRSLRQDSYRQAFPSIRKFSFGGEDDPSDSDSSDLEDNSDSE
ncbi:hypothetical protein B0H13DRAFT_2439228 [Mycena leptocephala]|nr:hypothetical protein B0H13DRAFT_2439228 [Mycena leptocephala]